ncbi:hypothetical protein Leryth_027238 [Lithospermum erythrorhizon]|nr:hypothetical protein Leryth_027238 [Lithospermum erythrorhizon]
MGKTGRDFTQIYTIYGVDDWQTPLFLLIHAISFAFLSVFFLLYFEPICYFSQHLFHFYLELPPPVAHCAFSSLLILRRREHLLLIGFTPMGNGSTHGQCCPRLVNGQTRPRPRLWSRRICHAACQEVWPAG